MHAISWHYNCPWWAGLCFIPAAGADFYTRPLLLASSMSSCSRPSMDTLSIGNISAPGQLHNADSSEFALALVLKATPALKSWPRLPAA